MSADRDPLRPYGSARDLPIAIEMTQSLKAMKLLTRFVAPGQRATAVEIERQLNQLYDTVDSFYSALGERHWIFTESMPLDEIGDLLKRSSDPSEVELGLIGIIGDRIRGHYWRMGLLGHEAMRARNRLLERARQHYLDEQWDSCALVLVSVIDGFVNDVEPAHRRGLHAREADEMVAWNSVVGHHKGLVAVMPEFLRSFKRRHDDDVFEVHRHGIVHGTVVNYNNIVVATKAWNLLAAIADWASAKEKAAVPTKEPPTFRETANAIARMAKSKRATEDFVPWSLNADSEDFERLDVIVAAREFLDAWQHSRWGIVARFLPSIITKSDSTDGARASRAKETYVRAPLGEYQLDAVTFPVLGAAAVTGHATIGDRTGLIRISWMEEAPDGNVKIDVDEKGRWVLAVAPS